MKRGILSSIGLILFFLSSARAADKKVDLTSPTLYEVGYAHLDTQWRWTYPEVIQDFLRHTMEDNFPLFEKYPDYIFNFTGSRRYELMKEYFPADFERLRQYVKAGRWFPDGSSVDECDNDIPSAESLVRQVLYGNEFYRKEFGVEDQDFMLPDSFGFSGALPEILAHCGLKGFSTQKLSWGSAIGIPFKVGVWIGPDGRSVLAALDPGAYNSPIHVDLSRSTAALQRIQQTGDASGVYTDFRYYGTGDVGGAPAEESVANLEASVHGNGPIHVISARSDQMFCDISEAQRERLPKYKGEFLLTWHSAGSITSQSAMKRWNRKNELLADDAERASAAAMWLGAAPYPSQRLLNAWYLVLGSQMHDMLAGTARADAYNFTWNDELLAMNQFASIARDAVGAIAAGMDTTSQGVPIVVYNPLSFARQELVDANVDLGSTGVEVIGPDGKVVPSEVLSTIGTRSHIVFLASVPSVGLAVYDARPRAADTPASSAFPVGVNQIENSRLRVTVNSDGDISSIFDKRNNREVLSSPTRLAFLHEKPILYPAWNMDWEDQRLPPRAYVDGPATIQLIESGPLRSTLRITRQADGSKFVQDISLCEGDAAGQVVVRNQIDWQTQESALKATFPTIVGNPIASYDSQVGVIERGNDNVKKYEVPQHQWFDLTAPDESFGVAVLNDCKYGSDKPDDHTMRLTLLYTPGVRGKYEDQATQDIGRQEMEYSIAPHAGDWRQGDVPRRAEALNQPMLVFQTAAHSGSGRTFSLLGLNTSQVEVTAIKKAEDGDHLIVRLRELEGRPAGNVRITAAAPIADAQEVDGQERPIGSAVLNNGSLVANLHAFDLRAFSISLDHPPQTEAAPTQQFVQLPFDLDGVSSASNPSDGAFSDDGQTYPAEEFPSHLNLDGIDFQLGSTADGAKNALACHGQTIALPDGLYDRVYFLASAVGGDQDEQFSGANLRIQDWAGNIGSWDRRLWSGELELRAFDWPAEWVGLVPGFVKPAEVAWFSNHRHNGANGNEFYQYCYLFKYGIDLAAGSGRTIVLPDNPHVRLFAMAVAGGGHDNLTVAWPISEVLDRQETAAPAIEPAGGKFSDTISVTLVHPLYWRAGALRYTTDASAVTAASPAYTDALTISSPTTIRAAMIDEDGHIGPEATAAFDVHDITPPRIVGATEIEGVPEVTVVFSKRVSADAAEAVANYQFTPPLDVQTATIGKDGCSVVLALAQPAEANVHRDLVARNIHDLAPAANQIDPTSVKLQVISPVFTQPNPTDQTIEIPVANLPADAGDSWTINLFCRPNGPVPDQTLIAGFGRADALSDGQGRYLAKFTRGGLHFWGHNADVNGDASLDIGRWQMLTATFDGQTIRLYKNARPAGKGDVRLSDDQATVRIAPIDPWDFQRTFPGEIRGMTVWNCALSEKALGAIWDQHKDVP